MENQTQKPFRILWLEDGFLELAAGVGGLRHLLSEKMNCQIDIIPAEWVVKAEEEIAGFRDLPPDVIVLDLMLPRTREDYERKPPGVDLNAGFAIWHRLRVQKLWGDAIASVPVLVVTAVGRPLFRPMMEADVRLRWLEKPVRLSTMVNEIIRLVSANADRRLGESGD